MYSNVYVMFQQLEVVPLYGDMQIKPYHYIQKSLNFDPSRWTFCESSQLSPQSNLLANLEAIREDHMAYISQLARHSNEVKKKGDKSTMYMYLDCYKYISKTLLKCKINAKIFIWQLKKKI